jgi:hypothetical protein
MRISVCTLMCILEPDPEASGYPGNKLHLYCLTGLHATNKVVVCSLICNRNLVCDEGTKLDCCDVNSAAGELDMTIITLGRLYFVLSCQLAPIESTPHVARETCIGEATCDLIGSHPSSGVSSKAIWVRLFSGLLV